MNSILGGWCERTGVYIYVCVCLYISAHWRLRYVSFNAPSTYDDAHTFIKKPSCRRSHVGSPQRWHSRSFRLLSISNNSKRRRHRRRRRCHHADHIHRINEKGRISAGCQYNSIHIHNIIFQYVL